MSQGELFDGEEARRRRDAGMEKVNRPEWSTKAEAFVAKYLPIDFEGLGEDVRDWMLGRGFPPPHHQNAWGSLIRNLVRHGILVKTGAYRQTRDPKSHARPTQVCRRAA